MNLDQQEKSAAKDQKSSGKKKLSRKEKKALKQAQAAAPAENSVKAKAPAPAPAAAKSAPSAHPAKPVKAREEVEAKLDLSPVQPVPPPQYTLWEKISPPARRKKQITNMESGFREVLGLVHSMRQNQEQLLDAFKKLPEAVDSVKKLADHSAQQSDLLKAMNEQMGLGSAGEFNKTLSSMDQTTQLLLERAQRSEEKLYSMLRRAQRRIAFMTLLVVMLFVGAVAAVFYVAFPEKAQPLLDKLGFGSNPTVATVAPIPAPVTKAPLSEPAPAVPDEPVVEPGPEPEIVIDKATEADTPEPPLPATVETEASESASPPEPEDPQPKISETLSESSDPLPETLAPDSDAFSAPDAE